MSHPRRIKSVADTRELRSGVIDALRGDARIDLRVRPHKVGDYWIDDVLAIERKSCRDFYGSIFDGRLFRQARELRRAAARCLILVEGMQFSRAFAAAPPWLSGALLTVTAGYQVPVLPSRSPAHTAELLRLLALEQVMERMGEPMFPKSAPFYSTDRWLRLRVLQAVPLIGPKRAAALLDRLETLGDIFTAPPDDVPKLGAASTFCGEPYSSPCVNQLARAASAARARVRRRCGSRSPRRGRSRDPWPA